MRMLHRNNGRKLIGTTPILGDNKAMFDIVQQEGASVRTRYFERAVLLIKRAVLLLILNPLLTKTQYMIADIFTKATDAGTFARMRNVMMNVNGGLRDTIQDSMSAMHGHAAAVCSRLLSHL